MAWLRTPLTHAYLHAGRYFNSVTTILPEFDGHYSCGAGYMYSGTPLVRTLLGPTQIVLIKRVALFQVFKKYKLNMFGTTCPYYSECPYFRGVRTVGLHCIPM